MLDAIEKKHAQPFEIIFRTEFEKNENKIENHPVLNRTHNIKN